MSKKTSRKKSESGTEDKAAVTRIVDEIVSGSSPLPDTTHLFSKIRELEDTTADYTAILSKKFSKSTIALNTNANSIGTQVALAGTTVTTVSANDMAFCRYAVAHLVVVDTQT